MFSWSEDRVRGVARALCEEAHWREHGFLPATATVERDLPAYLPLARAAILALHDPAALDELRDRRAAQLAALLDDPLPA